MAKFRILPESEVQARVDEVAALLTGHDNDPNAHGIGVLADTLGKNTARITALLTALRSMVATTFSDPLDGADNSLLTSTRWRPMFAGLPKLSGNAATGINAGSIYAASRLAGLDVIISVVVDVPAGVGEASVIARYDFASGNHVLVQIGAGGDLNIYAVTGNGATYTIVDSLLLLMFDPAMSLLNVVVDVWLSGTNLLLFINGVIAKAVKIPSTLSTVANNHAGIRVSGVGKVQRYQHGTLDGNWHLQRARMNTALAFRRSTISGRDTFDRADTASIGTAEVGGAWGFLLNKLPAIVSNAAKFTSAADADGAYLNVSVTNPLLRVLITTPATTDAAGVTFRFGTTGGTRLSRLERRGDGGLYMVRYDGSAYVETLLGWREVSGAPEYMSVLAVGRDVWVLIDGHLVAYLEHPDDPLNYNKHGIFIKGTGTVQDFLMLTVEPGVLA